MDCIQNQKIRGHTQSDFITLLTKIRGDTYTDNMAISQAWKIREDTQADNKVTSQACSTHFIRLDLIILVLSGKEYKLWSFSFFDFLQPPIISPLLGPH
jgi:hypothetical protein